MFSKARRKRVKHYEGNGHLHELTFSCVGRSPLLTNDSWKRVLSIKLKEALEEENFDLISFVIMPEHVHLLVLPAADDSSVSRLLARTKQPTSKTIKGLLKESDSSLLDKLTVRERPGKHCFRLWQEGPGFDRNVFSPQAIRASIDYIHMNPVRRGLCQRCTDWKWSSARFYEHGTVDPDLPVITRPDPYWFDASGVQHELG